MRKHYPLNSQGAEDAGQLPWTDGVPSTGVEGSYPGQALFVDTEAEILAAIDASGQARNGSDLTQLVQAIARGLYLGQFTGTANALAAVLANNVAFASLLRGARFTGFVTTTNTGSATVAITCLTGANAVVQAPLLTRSGNALAAGDLPVNQDFEIRWDGAAFRMVGSVASEGISPSQSLTIVKAAGSIFNFRTLQSSTRTNASAASAGLQVPVMSGLTYPKKSASSNVAVTLGFFSYSPVTAGQGNGAATARLVTSTSVFTDFALNNSLLVSGAPVGAGYNTPTIVLPGLPIGNIGLGLTYRRDDNASWNTIFNPNNSDFGGISNNPVSTLFVWEYEPGS